jgi:AmiR/NasT family two-component response regulator
VIASLTLASANGGDIIAALRRASAATAPKLLALIDLNDSAQVDHAVAAGASAWVGKPIDPKQLLSTVNAVMAAQIP